MATLDSYPLISPFLWFESQAAQAAALYISVFPNSRLLGPVNSSADNPSGPAGSVLIVPFELDGVKFTALNGGPGHPFSDAISFVVRCKSQAEIDHYWDALAANGTPGPCGWLKDPFGVSWQIIPAQLGELIGHPAAMQAMLTMKKLDIATLEAAAQS